MVQWLRFHAASAGDLGSIPDWESMISHALQGVCQKLKRKRKQMLCVSESHSQMLLVRPASSLPVVCLPAPPTGAHSLTLPCGYQVKWPFVYIFPIVLEIGHPMGPSQPPRAGSEKDLTRRGAQEVMKKARGKDVVQTLNAEGAGEDGGKLPLTRKASCRRWEWI